MSCNCINTNNTTCTQCSAGLTCNCPPDYSVAPQPVSCGCCPDGYTYVGITANFPNGQCDCIMSNGIMNTACVSLSVPAIPCTTCVDSVPADCVFVTNIPCLGVQQTPVALSSVLGYLCSEAFILSQLQTIGLSTTLKAALCEIISICPTVGATVPIPGPIVVTVP